MIKKKSTTLQDIADYCGLSKSTVAKALQNPDGCKMRRETVNTVLAAANKMDYHASMAAKMLRTKRSNTIGVIFPNICSFYRELVIYLDTEFAKRGLYGLFAYWNPADHSSYRTQYNRLRKYGVDGIITNDDDESVPSRELPTVIYGNELKIWDCVCPDKRSYAEDAVNYLYFKGHRKIGFIGRQGDVRFNYICKTIQQLGLELNENWMIDSRAFSAEGYENSRKLLQQKKLPSAIITHSDHIAFSLIHAAAEHGFKIPDDLSILSYDNLEEAKYSNPSLTTFDQSFKYVSGLLVDMLVRRIDNPDIPQQKGFFTMPLIERNSVKDITVGSA